MHFIYTYTLFTKSLIITVKKTSFEVLKFVGAPDGTLHELFNKILQPVLYKADTILLYERVKMYLEGLKIEKNSL